MEIIADFLNPYILIGAEGILVEGIRRVCKWEDNCIILTTVNSKITVTGKGLRPEYKSLDSLLVKGKVDSVGFERRKG